MPLAPDLLLPVYPLRRARVVFTCKCGRHLMHEAVHFFLDLIVWFEPDIKLQDDFVEACSTLTRGPPESNVGRRPLEMTSQRRSFGW